MIYIAPIFNIDSEAHMTIVKKSENEIDDSLEMTNFADLDYETQVSSKLTHLRRLIGSLSDQEIDVFGSKPLNYRMRAEFRVWHDGASTSHVMFNQQTKEKYSVSEFPLACEIINKAMGAVLDAIHKVPILRTKLFQIDYLASTTNQLVISMLYHKQLGEEWSVAAKQLAQQLSGVLGKVSILGRAKKQKLIIGCDYVIEKLKINNRTYEFKHIENSFTQPNAEINVKMIEWVITHAASKQSDLLELYCGAGNFSIPLSQYFRKVLATEISKTSVNAAQHNIETNNISNLNIVRLSSEEFVEAHTGNRTFNRLREVELSSYQFKTVLVDPPRAGLDQSTLELVAKFEKIVYISCNPKTLVENLKTLSITHKIDRIALFDQFPQTHHLESGVILTRK